MAAKTHTTNCFKTTKRTAKICFYINHSINQSIINKTGNQQTISVSCILTWLHTTGNHHSWVSVICWTLWRRGIKPSSRYERTCPGSRSSSTDRLPTLSLPYACWEARTVAAGPATSVAGRNWWSSPAYNNNNSVHWLIAPHCS